MDKKHNLIAKQKRFCEIYVIDHNGTQAAIGAGYSKNGAAVTASRLLTKTNIIAYVDKLEEDVMLKLGEKHLITKEKILIERSRIAFFNIKELYDNDGNLLPTSKLSDDAAAVVSGIKVRKIFIGTGKKQKHIGDTVEVKVWNKDTSLIAIEKMFGLYGKQQLEISGPDGKPIEIRSADPVEASKQYSEMIKKLNSE